MKNLIKLMVNKIQNNKENTLNQQNLSIQKTSFFVVEYKNVWLKRSIDCQLDTLISLSTELSIIIEIEDYSEQRRRVKHLFLRSYRKPVVKRKQTPFVLLFNDEKLGWHHIISSSTGKGKSYFTEILLIQSIYSSILKFVASVLDFMEDQQTNDPCLISMNFEHHWQTLLNNIQNNLLSCDKHS